MTLLAARALTKSYGSRLILDGADLSVEPRARIGVVGPNGSGKSTLLKILAGQETPDGGEVSRRRAARVAYLDQHPAGDTRAALEITPTSGEVWVGPSISIGYLAQEQDTLDPASTPLDTVRRAVPVSEADAVSLLMKFLFPYEQVRRANRLLSGGERTRLQLLLLMLARPNLLVLDEPTNHLDIESVEVLETAIEEFTGTVVAISHDRYFLDRVADRIVEVDGSVRATDGGYSAWLERKTAATG